MNGRQITGNNFPANHAGDSLRPEPAPVEVLSRTPTGFMHPSEVVSDLQLTQAEKREVLASWASDARAVPDAPSLRQLGNGAVVRVDDILRALQLLDDGKVFEHATPGPLRRFAGVHVRLPTRLKSALRRNWSDDDDDPPPCPATIIGPLGGPLSGAGTADASLALAA